MRKNSILRFAEILVLCNISVFLRQKLNILQKTCMHTLLATDEVKLGYNLARSNQGGFCRTHSVSVETIRD